MLGFREYDGLGDPVVDSTPVRLEQVRSIFFQQHEFRFGRAAIRTDVRERFAGIGPLVSANQASPD